MWALCLCVSDRTEYKGGRSHCIYIYAHLVPFAALIKIAVALS